MAENRDERAVATAEPEPGDVVKRKGGLTAEEDVVGGNVAESFSTPVTGAARDTNRARRLMLRAAKARGVQRVGALVGRPLDEWGLVGEGDRVLGHYMLIDLDTLKKVEVIDEWVVEGDRIFANAQQWPKALVHGDTLEKL